MRLPLAITFAFVLAFFAGASPSRAAHSPEMACLPPYLKLTFERLEDKFGHAEVVSAHRPGARVAGAHRVSKHSDCRAIDFNPPRGKYKQVITWLHKNHEGGLGTYSCGMHHIHIDSGKEREWHTCAGGSRHRHYASRHGRRGHYASGSPRSRRYAGRSGRHQHYASRSYRHRHEASRSPGHNRHASRSSSRYASR